MAQLTNGGISSLLFSYVLVKAEYTYQDPANYPTDFPLFTVDARFAGQARNLMSNTPLNLLAPLASSGENNKATAFLPTKAKDNKCYFSFFIPLFPAIYSSSTGDTLKVSWTSPTGWTVTVYGIEPVVSDVHGAQPCFIQYSQSTLTAGNNPIQAERCVFQSANVTQIQQRGFPNPITSTPVELYEQPLFVGDLPLNFQANDYTSLYLFMQSLYCEGGDPQNPKGLLINTTANTLVLQSEKIAY